MRKNAANTRIGSVFLYAKKPTARIAAGFFTVFTEVIQIAQTTPNVIIFDRFSTTKKDL
jgi:hypothetical protein